MPTFTKPSSFVTVRGYPVLSEIALSISDMASVVAEHLRLYLDNPEAFSGLPSIQASNLLSDIQIFQEASKIAQSGKTDWILITPGKVQHSVMSDIADIGVVVRNSSSPPGTNVRILTTAAGKIPERETCILERSILVIVSLRSMPAAFRAADAIYTWLAAMRPVLKLEYNCRQIALVPISPATDTERPLFAPLAGNPLITGITATSFVSFNYGVPDPA